MVSVHGSNCRHENLLPLRGFSHEFGLLPATVFPWIHNSSLTTYLEHHFTELTIKRTRERA
ncbi:hypothetical protein C8R48DRAFT_695785 [Suillus tomentosus]|nr:hypothetical protein C8R48DRAFT_695785 [Suillus tomentosus]